MRERQIRQRTIATGHGDYCHDQPIQWWARSIVRRDSLGRANGGYHQWIEYACAMCGIASFLVNADDLAAEMLREAGETR